MLPKKKKTDLKRKKDKKGEVKSVSFYPDCTVMNTLHLNDYTDQEMRDCWYSYTELKHIRKEARTTIGIPGPGCNFTTARTQKNCLVA